MLSADLDVGEPARRRAGLAVFAALASAAVFAAVTVVSKETPALNLRQPWQDDPFDVPVSLDFVAVPLLVVIGTLRVQLCRRYEPLPTRRLVDVLRLAGAALAVSLATETAEWSAVVLGRHRASWTAATTWQIAALTVLTTATLAAWLLVRRAGRSVSRIARVAAQPDWLTDAVALSLRAVPFFGRHRGRASAVIRWTDAHLIARVRAHCIVAAAILAVALTVPFVAAKVVLEGYPTSLVLLIFVFVAASLFTFVVGVGAYVRVVAPRASSPPSWLITALVACAAGTVAFAFHDWLLARQTVTGLSALYFGAVLAAAALTWTLQKVRAVRAHAGPADP